MPVVVAIVMMVVVTIVVAAPAASGGNVIHRLRRRGDDHARPVAVSVGGRRGRRAVARRIVGDIDAGRGAEGAADDGAVASADVLSDHGAGAAADHAADDRVAGLRRRRRDQTERQRDEGEKVAEGGFHDVFQAGLGTDSA